MDRAAADRLARDGARDTLHTQRFRTRITDCFGIRHPASPARAGFREVRGAAALIAYP